MTCRTQTRTGAVGGLGRQEPAFREGLQDPIVKTLMARDGISLGDIRYLMDLVQGLQDRSTVPEQAA